MASEQPSYMEPELQAYYKCLAELKMRVPANFNHPNLNVERLRQLCQTADQYLSAKTRGDQEQVIYAEKFKHFTHLFFADEKLDLESKYKQGAKVNYVGHRPAKRGSGSRRGRGSAYAVYKFRLEDQGMEELIQYAKVDIGGMTGTITNVLKEQQSIEVAFEDSPKSPQQPSLYFDESEQYSIDLKFNDRMYKAHMHTIWLLQTMGRAKFAAFPNTNGLISNFEYERQLCQYEYELERLGGENGFDKQQNQAIFSIVRGLHGTIPFVLWGPPGTGKTVTIAECICRLLEQNESNRILICTPSNSAADLVARKILAIKDMPLQPHQMRRYYSLGRNTNDRDMKLDRIIKIENASLCGLDEERFAIDTYKEMKVQDIRLIFSTLACSAYLGDKIQEEDFFSHIFIDEASQSFEPETLIPITRFATEKTRIILSGDHQQLGAVMKAHFLKGYKECTGSLMERLIGMRERVYTDGRTFCQLTDSYRCHPAIIKFSSDQFYNSKLRAVMAHERRAFCQWRHLPKPDFPLILHICSEGAEERQKDGRSFHNADEVDAVLTYITLVRLEGIDDTEIGVISPYKHQARMIRERLGQEGRNITVDSVECYQGSERRVIIMSLSRSEQPGFLTEYKRMNTSFTRAKELLIVVISMDFVRILNRSPVNYWIKFIEYCLENRAVTIDKFVGMQDTEEGGLDANEAEQFKRRIEECLRNPGVKLTAREDRKKRPLVQDDLELAQRKLDQLGLGPSSSAAARQKQVYAMGVGSFMQKLRAEQQASEQLNTTTSSSGSNNTSPVKQVSLALAQKKLGELGLGPKAKPTTSSSTPAPSTAIVIGTSMQKLGAEPAVDTTTSSSSSPTSTASSSLPTPKEGPSSPQALALAKMLPSKEVPIGPEGAKAKLNQMRGDPAFLSSDSSEDGVEFWSRQFARAPERAEHERRPFKRGGGIGPGRGQSRGGGGRPSGMAPSSSSSAGGIHAQAGGDVPVYHVCSLMAFDVGQNDVGNVGEEEDETWAYEQQRKEEEEDEEMNELLMGMSECSLASAAPANPSEQYIPPQSRGKESAWHPLQQTPPHSSSSSRHLQQSANAVGSPESVVPSSPNPPVQSVWDSPRNEQISANSLPIDEVASEGTELEGNNGGGAAAAAGTSEHWQFSKQADGKHCILM